MSTYRQIFYQIVFGTKHRRKTITGEYDRELYKYIFGIIKNKNCQLYQINGIEDHIHIFTDLHPSVCLSDFVKDIKVASSIWMKQSGFFPLFTGWQAGYGAFTYSVREKEMIINYIKKQKAHHKTESFRNEYLRVLAENNIVPDERFFLEEEDVQPPARLETPCGSSRGPLGSMELTPSA